MRSTSIHRALMALLLAGGLSLAACDQTSSDKKDMTTPAPSGQPAENPYGSGPVEEQPGSKPTSSDTSGAATDNQQQPAGGDAGSTESGSTESGSTEPYGGGPSGEDPLQDGWMKIQEGMDQIREEADRRATEGSDEVAAAAEEVRKSTEDFEKDIEKSIDKLQKSMDMNAPADSQPGNTSPSETGAPEQY
ncbi:hypothetical protein DL240_10810 [Lujinxingia litoralis]|uniref:Uncharacterized protein n=1 Tax=Lujinxingia litoralis TaxID=2211119 RepID=A0A328C692_9DELT|nr:hypothetical protein [Lujinxingia litoralis]RAL22332.1 hypothetical protein DL240_10810 [Lujinxingia litoralis]